MGRKIPGKKHKRVKDPVVQQALRDERLKNKINAPPTDPDEQETPKSLQNLARLMKIAQSSNSNSKFKKQKGRLKNRLVDMSKFTTKEVVLPGMKKSSRPMPSLIQWEGETPDNFMKRVDEATQSVINEVEFEEQFGVSVRHKPDGEVLSVELAKPDEWEGKRLQKKKRNEKRKKNLLKRNNSGVDAAGDEVLNRKQRKKAKLLAKREEIHLQNEEKFKLQDHVKFGEVVHQPPQITVRPKYSGAINKPGVKGDLLLHKMFHPNKLKAERKHKNLLISPAARKKKDEERNHVIQLYRQMKANKQKHVNK